MCAVQGCIFNDPIFKGETDFSIETLAQVDFDMLTRQFQMGIKVLLPG